MPEPYDDDDEATDQDWAQAGESVASDLDNFEAYIWPRFKERGYTRELAVICFYLHLVVVEKRGG